MLNLLNFEKTRGIVILGSKEARDLIHYALSRSAEASCIKTYCDIIDRMLENDDPQKENIKYEVDAIRRWATDIESDSDKLRDLVR